MTRHYLDILAEVIRTNWNQPALTDYATLDGGEGNSYTYGEMYGQIRALCDRFRQLGIQKGDHIAICGANSANWAVAYLAIAAYQAVSVTILHTQTPEEITRQIDFADATTIIVDIDIWERLNQTQLFKVQHVLSLRDFTSLIDATAFNLSTSTLGAEEMCFDLQPLDTLAQICFTSGSTEQAKGVMLSFRNLSANVLFRIEEFQGYCNTSLLSILPMAHIYGLVVEDLLPLCVGAHLFVTQSFTIPSLVNICKRIHPKLLIIVPAIVDGLAKYCTLLKEALPLKEAMGGEIDFISLGGGCLDFNTAKLLEESHVSVATGYGMTECAPRITHASAYEYIIGSVGRIVHTLECRIASNGEILVRGENVMLGYYKDPEATAAKIDKDGWLHTGDRGHLDEEGNLYVEGRLEQDMVVLPSGENISLPNVESIINQVDGVEESLVLARNGHLVALVYTAANLNRQNLLRTINPQLPSFSQLYDLEFVSAPFQRTEKRTLKRYLYQ